MLSPKSQQKALRKAQAEKEEQWRDHVLMNGPSLADPDFDEDNPDHWNGFVSDEEHAHIKDLYRNSWARIQTIRDLNHAAFFRKHLAHLKLSQDYDTVIRNSAKRALGVPIPKNAWTDPLSLDPNKPNPRAAERMDHDRDGHRRSLYAASRHMMDTYYLP